MCLVEALSWRIWKHPQVPPTTRPCQLENEMHCLCSDSPSDVLRRDPEIIDYYPRNALGKRETCH